MLQVKDSTEALAKQATVKEIAMLKERWWSSSLSTT
jgi:hypothetical protein